MQSPKSLAPFTLGFQWTQLCAIKSDELGCFSKLHSEPAEERSAAAETWRSGVLGSSRASLAPVPAPVSRRDKTAANVAATSFGVQPHNSPHQTELGQVRASVYRTTTSDSRRGPSSQWPLPPPKTTRPQDQTDVQRCLWARFSCQGKSRGRN